MKHRDKKKPPQPPQQAQQPQQQPQWQGVQQQQDQQQRTPQQGYGQSFFQIPDPTPPAPGPSPAGPSPFQSAIQSPYAATPAGTSASASAVASPRATAPGPSTPQLLRRDSGSREASIGGSSITRAPSMGLAARIQAAELAAAGTFDPASWAAAAAEAVKADKEAAAAAARRAREEEDRKRREESMAAAAAALAAGRVSAATSTAAHSETGAAEQQPQFQPQPFSPTASGWTTSYRQSFEGGERFESAVVSPRSRMMFGRYADDPAAAAAAAARLGSHPIPQQAATLSSSSSSFGDSSSSTEAAAAAALAAVTASYSSTAAAAAATTASSSSPARRAAGPEREKDPARIAAEFVQMQRQASLVRPQESYEIETPGAGSSFFFTGLEPTVLKEPSLRQQFAAASSMGSPQSATAAAAAATATAAAAASSSTDPVHWHQNPVMGEQYSSSLPTSPGISSSYQQRPLQQVASPAPQESPHTPDPNLTEPQEMRLGGSRSYADAGKASASLKVHPGSPQLSQQQIEPSENTAAAAAAAAVSGSIASGFRMRYQEQLQQQQPEQLQQGYAQLSEEHTQQQQSPQTSASKLRTLIAAETALKKRSSPSGSPSASVMGVAETEFRRRTSSASGVHERSRLDPQSQRGSDAGQQQSPATASTTIPTPSSYNLGKAGVLGPLFGVRRVSTASSRLSSSGGGAASPAAPGDVEAQGPVASSTKPQSASGRLSSDGGSTQEQSRKRRHSKKRKVCCVLLPLLVLLAAGGVAVGVWQGVTRSQQRATAGESAETVPTLKFKVTVSAPTRTNKDVACAKWFGTDESLSNYSAVFSGAYSSALKLPPSHFSIKNLDCGGVPMFSDPSGSGNSSGQESAAVSSLSSKSSSPSSNSQQSRLRMALARRDAAAAAAVAVAAQPYGNSAGGRGAAASDRNVVGRYLLQASQVSDKPVSPSASTNVVTTFEVPAPANRTARAALIYAITKNSGDILTDPLSKLLGVPVTVESVEQVVEGVTAREGVSPEVPPKEGAVAREVPGEAPSHPASPKVPTSPPGRPTRPPERPVAVAVPAAGQEELPWQLPTGEQPRPSQRPEGQPEYTPAVKPPAPPKKPVAPALPPGKPTKPPAQLPKPVKPPKPPANDVFYESAPSCSVPPTVGNSIMDTYGRLWGWEKWQSCVFRDYNSVQPERVNSAWESAPPCVEPPQPGNSASDGNGMLWGWENSQSCAFRDKNYTPQPQPNQPAWDTAPACRFPPSDINSVSDSTGQLWGWQNDESCAFRGGTYYESTRAGGITWFAAPTCKFSPTIANSVPDVDGRLWGWQDNKSCAFRPSQGR